jgi:hypothetical protein
MSISSDWILLFLRLVFVVLLYFFLFQVVRLTTRELALLAREDSRLPASRRATGRLVVVDLAETSLPIGAAFPLMPVTVIGRRPSCTVVLDDTFVSAEHAELEVTRQGWLLRDLGSTNGTFVNGQMVIGTTDVADDDIVQFGRVRLKLMC